MKKSSSFNPKEKNYSVEEIMLDFLNGITVVYKNTFALRGCMCLKMQLDFKNDIRGTRDLDMDFFTKDDWEFFVYNCCAIATNYSKLGVRYYLVSRRGFNKNPNGDSLKLKGVMDDKEYLFKLDMNIKNPVEYDDGEHGLKISRLNDIIGDKLSVLYTPKSCRRIKDLIDIYYIAKYVNIESLNSLCEFLRQKDVIQNVLSLHSCFIMDKTNYDVLNHAYSKYTFYAGVKPEFCDVYKLALNFIEPICMTLAGVIINDCKWDRSELKWKEMNCVR